MIAKLSNIVRELLLVKKEYILILLTEKVDVHQDNWKSQKDLSPLEQLNIKHNSEAKNLIISAMQVGYNLGLMLQLSSLLILYKGTDILVNAEDLRTTMYRSLVWLYLQSKLNTNQEKIDLDLRNKVMKKVLKYLYIWHLKSFANFAGTAHKLYR